MLTTHTLADWYASLSDTQRTQPELRDLFPALESLARLRADLEDLAARPGLTHADGDRLRIVADALVVFAPALPYLAGLLPTQQGRRKGDTREAVRRWADREMARLPLTAATLRGQAKELAERLRAMPTWSSEVSHLRDVADLADTIRKALRARPTK